MSLWRLQTNPSNSNGKKIADYCIDNSIMALGWVIDGEAINSGMKIDTITAYQAAIGKTGQYNGKINPNVKRLYYDVAGDDLVWIRSSGIYWLGRVTENSKWRYDASPEAYDYGASNQRTDIDWVKIGDESDVPGIVTTSLIRGNTLQRINNDFALKYSQLLFNKMKNEQIYKDIRLNNAEHNFYDLLLPKDCEDLLCMWLYNEYNYVVIPSTNKHSTERYECVMKNIGNNGSPVYIQVKKGEQDLKEIDYVHLTEGGGEVWLFTTNGKVEPDGVQKHDRIHTVNPTDIYNFAMNRNNDSILPRGILNWRDMLLNQ